MLEDNNPRILAIDYGRMRIGIAVSDPLKLFPSKTFTMNNGSKTFSEIKKIITENNIELIILGFPFGSNESTIQLSEEILKFKAEVEDIAKVEVRLWDESFTSKIAESRIIDSISKKSKRQDKSLVDSHSAAILLEEYLRSSHK
jgi:putative Holliday junction resolvase